MNLAHTLYTTRGAVTAVAITLGISLAAVSQWRRRGIPEDRVPAVEAALREYLAKIDARPAAPVAIHTPVENEAAQ